MGLDSEVSVVVKNVIDDKSFHLLAVLTIAANYIPFFSGQHSAIRRRQDEMLQFFVTTSSVQSNMLATIVQLAS